jgi:hypothetical protein
MIIISNTTPLIGLASLRRFDLLHSLFDKIYIPQAVYQEAVILGREVGGAKHEVTTATWIETVTVTNQVAVKMLLETLDRGEAETIILALEMGADWVLMDEKRGRRKLTELNLNKIGTLGILLKAKQLGLLPVIRPEIEQLCSHGFSLSQAVIDSVLQQAGE